MKTVGTILVTLVGVIMFIALITSVDDCKKSVDALSDRLFERDAFPAAKPKSWNYRVVTYDEAGPGVFTFPSTQILLLGGRGWEVVGAYPDSVVHGVVLLRRDDEDTRQDPEMPAVKK